MASDIERQARIKRKLKRANERHALREKPKITYRAHRRGNFKGEAKAFEFEIKPRDPKKRKVTGNFYYHPPRTHKDWYTGRTLKDPGMIDIKSSFARTKHEEAVPWKDIKNKALSRKQIRHFLEKTSLKFPNAEEASGVRSTGAHATSEHSNPIQKFDLNRVRKQIAKRGKTFKGILGPLAIGSTLGAWKERIYGK